MEELSEPVKVYNFEVEEYHTYYVGEAGVLVHNDNCGQGNEGGSGSRFSENPEELFPEGYAGLEKEMKPDGKLIILYKQVIKHIKLNITLNTKVMGTMMVIIIMF